MKLLIGNDFFSFLRSVDKYSEEVIELSLSFFDTGL